MFLFPLSSFAQIDTTNVWFSNGPTGQTFIQDIVFSPVSPDTMYAAVTLPGTVFRSLNRGSTWTEVGAGLATGVVSLAINPKNRNVIFAGTSGKGVYRSTNLGIAWAAMNTGLPDTTVNVIRINPVDTNRVWAGTPDSLFTSANRGQTWVSARLDSVEITDIVMNPLRPDTIYVATKSSGIFRSYNGGGATESSWVAVNTGLGSLEISALAIHPTQPDTIYAATFSSGVYRSINGGHTWTAVNNGLSVLTLTTISIARSIPTVLYAGTTNGTRIFKATDNAATWTEISRNMSTGGASIGAIAVRPDSANVVYAGLNTVQRLKQVGLDQKLVLPVQNVPNAVGVADLNGDGALDPILINTENGSLTFLTNQARGALFVPGIFTVGGEPVAVAAGDIDKDGDVDLAVGNRGTQVVSVLLNGGTGQFSARQDLFIGQVPVATRLADVDGDSRRDVLSITAPPGNNLSIFFNSGVGNFVSQRLFPCGTDPRAFVVADFNRDGLLDVLVANGSPRVVSLLHNLGGGQFSAPQTISVVGTPIGIVSGDFDLDGFMDAAVITSDLWELVVLLNTGNGGFTISQRRTLETQPLAIVRGDLDKDGYADLLISVNNRAALLYANNGSGRFTLGPDTFEAAISMNSMGLEDLDLDGDLDMFAVQTGPKLLHVKRNDLVQNIKMPAPPRNVTAEDVEGDLGGRIRLNWTRPLADELTGRISRYSVYRAGVKQGPYQLVGEVDTTSTTLLADSLTVRGSFIDSSGTVGAPYSYYLTARSVNHVVSAPSDTVSALSTAQPFFDFNFSGAGVYHVGDTVRVSVALVPLAHQVTGVSLFLKYDTRALLVLDGLSSVAGLQPFQPDPFVLQSSQVLENRLNKDVAGHINYSLAGFAVPDTARIALGTIRFLALKDTLSQITVVDSPLVNRSTSLIAQGTGKVIRPYLVPGTYGVQVKGVRVSGRVALQGRNGSNGGQLRVDLRKQNGTALDTMYYPPIDLDQNPLNGVQVNASASGRFEIIQVPARKYSLFVKSYHYLRARVLSDSLTVGTASPSELRFRWVSSTGGVRLDTLRGGDANDDDRVNLADFGILASNFGKSSVTEGQPAWGADFNGDGAVNLADFGILASNFGEVGMGQGLLFKPAATPPAFVLSPGEEGEYVLHLARPVAGFSAEVGPAIEGGLAVLVQAGAATEPEFSPVHWIQGEGARSRVRIAAHTRMPGVMLPQGAEVARIQSDGGPPMLEQLLVLDAQGNLSAAGLVIGEDLSAPEGPAQNALYQNIPNPFNPSTTIRFDVSEPSAVRLVIYSVLGQEIRSLVRDFRQPGVYTVVWDGEDRFGRPVASGVYFYGISVGSFRDVRKLLLLR